MKPNKLAMLACIATGMSHVVAAAPDPADANSPIAPAVYRSPFADYRPLGEDKSTPWKDANDTVGRIGGWRAYALEAAEAMKAQKAREAPEAGGAKPPPPPQPPAPPRQAPPATTHKHGG